MKYRYIIGERYDPYYNLAMEQSLFKDVKDGEAILFFWQNDNTIVIGRNQNPFLECKAVEFQSIGGKIARRHSGGGAVFHDLGNLNYSIISTLADSEQCRYQLVVSNALSKYGFDVDFNGRNDLTLNGKKISGNAFYTDGQVMCQHGTLLVDTDVEKMNYYLTPDRAKLARSCVKSVKSRVCNLKEVDSCVTIERLKNAFIESFVAEPMMCCLQENDINIFERKYSSDEWIFRGNFE